MDTISTALTLLNVVVAIAAGVAAWIAWRAASDADHDARELQKGLRKLTTVTDEVTALHARFDRLAGRVYAVTRIKPPKPTNGDDLDTGPYAADSMQRGFDELDPELAAEIALQRAEPIAPGRK